MASYNLIGRRRYSAVSRKTACKSFSASILGLCKVFVKVLIDTDVNISNELILSDVYRSVMTLGR